MMWHPRVPEPNQMALVLNRLSSSQVLWWILGHDLAREHLGASDSGHCSMSQAGPKHPD